MKTTKKTVSAAIFAGLLKVRFVPEADVGRSVLKRHVRFVKATVPVPTYAGFGNLLA